MAESDTNGNVWFFTDMGLSRYNGNQFINHDISTTGIAAKDIRGLYSKGNNFFIYTNRGVIDYNLSNGYSSAPGIINKASAGLLNDTIVTVKTFGDQNWIANINGISVLKGGIWSHQKDTLVTDFGLSNDTCYLATKGFGVSRYIITADGFTGASVYENGFGCIINDTVYSICIAKNKVQWYGTKNGVFQHSSSEFKQGWRPFYDYDGLPENKVYLLTEDSQGRIWAGTESGVAFYDGISWNKFSSAKINAIKEDQSGNVWIATAKGLIKYKDDWKLYSEADGISGNVIRSIAVVSDGSIWFATDNGATQYKDTKFTIYRSIAQE